MKSKMKRFLSLTLVTMLLLCLGTVVKAEEAIEISDATVEAAATPAPVEEAPAAPVVIEEVPVAVEESPAAPAPVEEAPAVVVEEVPAALVEEAPPVVEAPTVAPETSVPHAEDSAQEPAAESVETPATEVIEEPVEEVAIEEPAEELVEAEGAIEELVEEPQIDGSVTIQLRNGKSGSFEYGDLVILEASLSGFEGVNHRIIWQYSESENEWSNANSDGSTVYQFQLDKQNANWSWRAVVDVI